MALRIIVPVDGSVPSDRAVAWTVAFARRTAAHVTFCSVVDPLLALMPLAAGAAMDPGPMLETLETGAGVFCAAAVECLTANGGSATTAILHGTPAEEIDTFAGSDAADFIVLGTHARRGISRGILGSVTGAVIGSTRVPVLVVRAGTELLADGPIIVAVDDSQASAAAATFALTLARALDVAVQLVHVVADADRRRGRDARQTAVERIVPPAIHAALDTIARAAAIVGVPCSTEIRDGDIVATLVAIAQHGGSLLVTGTHGRGAVGRLFLGSVAEGCVRDAAVPVVVVRDAG